MKRIATLLLATFVAISSFAQSWTEVGIARIGSLSVRNITKSNTDGDFTAEFRVVYSIKVKTDEGQIVESSFMKIMMNCISRKSKLLGDVHVSDGKTIPNYTNSWLKSGEDGGAVTSAASIVMSEVCSKKNII